MAHDLNLILHMYVRDLMQHEVATLRVSDTLDLADDIMRLGRIRHLPVVEGDRLVGILSQRDLFRAAVSSVLQFRRPAEQEWLATVPVQAVMTPAPLTVGPETSIRTAVATMLERRIGCLPVVENGRLVGLLSESDCMRQLAHLLDLAVKDRLSELVAPA
jgi:CBS domain-containing protein